MLRNNVLSLNLTYYWYELIKSGKKTTEYRRYCDYWNKRFKNNQYDIVVLHRGYSKENIAFKINTIKLLKNQPNDLNESICWAIELGEKIENFRIGNTINCSNK